MPEAVDAENLREVLDYYGTWLAFNQRYLRIPGVQAAVYAGDGIAFSDAYGLADVAQGVALTERHLFRIASHSKTFTATAVLQLVERNLLRLDDLAAVHVPELAGAPAGQATVRDLLNHVGGLTRDGQDSDFWQLGAEFPDRAQLVAVLNQEWAAVLPSNERFKYSNIGFGLLGLIIEAVTGTSYAEYVQAEIAARLGLADIGPELDQARLGDYAIGYSGLSYSSERVPIDHVDTRALASATGYFATARDLVSYFAAHRPGDERLLSDASKRLMQHPAWPVEPDKADQRYGLGLSVVKVGERRLFGHGGGYPGHITRSLVDPDRGLVASVLTNAIDAPALRLAQAASRLLDLAVSKDRPAGTEDLHRFTGRFANLWGVEDIALLGGRLYAIDPTADDPAAEPVPLEPDGDSLRVTGGDGYGAYGESYRYTFEDGKVASLRAPNGLALHPFETYSLPDRVVARPGRS
jgi:CubicO group peptidase (beta-lactamase class C family)